MLIPRCQCEDIQIAFKIGCINNHNSVAKKTKKKKRQIFIKEKLSKSENKQIVQSLQELINVY